MEQSELNNSGQEKCWQDLLEGMKNSASLEALKALCRSYSDMYDGADDASCSFVVDTRLLNSQRYLNRHLIYVNRKMRQDGIFVTAFHSSENHYRSLRQRHPRTYGFFHFWDFLWHRACPKFVLTRRLYFSIYRQVKRVYPVPEVLGRLSFCGFEILHMELVDGRNVVVARKKGEPSTDEHPSYDLLIRLRRVGKDGKRIGVYKFRTMYAYSEYLQQYVYEHNMLDKSGKFANDFRVSGWGKMLRKYWLDELPMILNILKGEMRFVGVRPLSEQYYSLYTPEMQAYRIKTKPGLLPPYYVDMPEGLAEVQQSEKKYLDAYFQHPFRTQWGYFWKIIGSILFKRNRSH